MFIFHLLVMCIFWIFSVHFRYIFCVKEILGTCVSTKCIFCYALGTFVLCTCVFFIRLCGNRVCTFSAGVFSYSRVVHFFCKRIFGQQLWKQNPLFWCICISAGSGFLKSRMPKNVFKWSESPSSLENSTPACSSSHPALRNAFRGSLPRLACPHQSAYTWQKHLQTAPCAGHLFCTTFTLLAEEQHTDEKNFKPRFGLNGPHRSPATVPASPPARASASPIQGPYKPLTATLRLASASPHARTIILQSAPNTGILQQRRKDSSILQWHLATNHNFFWG